MSRSLLALTAVVLIVGTNAAAGAQRYTPYREAVWSPNAKRIAFIKENDVYVMNLNGSALRRVTTDGVFKQDLAWSPRGKWIAYSANLDVEVVSPDGTQHRALTGKGGAQPDFSPSGRRIAFTDFLTYGHAIKVMYEDGSEQAAVTQWEGNGEVLNYPTWSANGRRLAFAVGDEGDAPSVSPHLAIIGQTGGLRTGLAFGHNVFSIDWSPDGRKILLVENDYTISLLDLKTRKTRTLGQRAVFKAHWSPKGGRILFGNEDGIFVMNSNGSHVHRLLPR